MGRLGPRRCARWRTPQTRQRRRGREPGGERVELGHKRRKRATFVLHLLACLHIRTNSSAHSEVEQKGGRRGLWKGRADLFLLLERARQLCGPRICFLALRLFSRETRSPFALDVLAHSSQRCTEVVLVSLDDHLELADVARLLAEQTVLLAFWRVGGQLGAREECRFEREDLRRLGLDFAARGEELLLKLCVA